MTPSPSQEEKDQYIHKIDKLRGKIRELRNEVEGYIDFLPKLQGPIDDVRLISLNNILAIFHHASRQLNILTRDLDFLSELHVKNIKKALEEQFPQIDKTTRNELILHIAEILSIKYTLGKEELNPYNVDNTYDWEFLQNQLILTLLIMTFPSIDNLLTHLAKALCIPKDSHSNFSTTLKSLESALGLKLEFREISFYRNAWMHSNGLMKDGKIATVTFNEVLDMQDKMVDTLREILLHEKIKNKPLIQDSAVAQYIKVNCHQTISLSFAYLKINETVPRFVEILKRALNSILEFNHKMG